MANKVELKTLVEKMNLKNLTPDVDLSDKDVEIPDIILIQNVYRSLVM